MLNLNTTKVQKHLEDGNYTATITRYETPADSDTLVVYFLVDDQELRDNVDQTGKTKEGKEWSPLDAFLRTLGQYNYQPTAKELLDSVINDKTLLNVAVNKGRYVRLLPPDAPTTSEETVESSAPVRRRRA